MTDSNINKYTAKYVIFLSITGKKYKIPLSDLEFYKGSFLYMIKQWNQSTQSTQFNVDDDAYDDDNEKTELVKTKLSDAIMKRLGGVYSTGIWKDFNPYLRKCKMEHDGITDFYNLCGYLGLPDEYEYYDEYDSAEEEYDNDYEKINQLNASFMENSMNNGSHAIYSCYD